jgi:hypothetical protein
VKCRRCGGRGRCTGDVSDCYLCLGHGTVLVPIKELEEYFDQIEQKYKANSPSESSPSISDAGTT